MKTKDKVAAHVSLKRFTQDRAAVKATRQPQQRQKASKRRDPRTPHASSPTPTTERFQ